MLGVVLENLFPMIFGGFLCIFIDCSHLTCSFCVSISLFPKGEPVSLTFQLSASSSSLSFYLQVLVLLLAACVYNYIVLCNYLCVIIITFFDILILEPIEYKYPLCLEQHLLLSVCCVHGTSPALLWTLHGRLFHALL